MKWEKFAILMKKKAKSALWLSLIRMICNSSLKKINYSVKKNDRRIEVMMIS